MSTGSEKDSKEGRDGEQRTQAGRRHWKLTFGAGWNLVVLGLLSALAQGPLNLRVSSVMSFQYFYEILASCINHMDDVRRKRNLISYNSVSNRS